MVNPMEEKLFSLMHKNNLVCGISIDPLSGHILRVSKPLAPELLPLGGNIDAATLRKWWQRRAVPVSQGKIQHILNQLGITTPQEYLVKNLGLSLTDHYWIKPLDMELGWEDINLFTNDFRDPVGEMQLEEHRPYELPENAFSPSSSTQGDLKDIPVNSFRKTETELLKLVQKPDFLDISRLPTVDELQALYEADPMIPRLDAVLLGYQKKIELLSK